MNFLSCVVVKGHNETSALSMVKSYGGKTVAVKCTEISDYTLIRAIKSDAAVTRILFIRFIKSVDNLGFDCDTAEKQH
jgi:hypothetical protein